ncbi:MAG TPA: hypothetical protein VIF40_10350, partial [Methylosinus sp.]|uniref:hypothetical protein n=1 Tax=Methylosinus sp. TaxID=427 RepID=UPI002F92C33F
HPLISSAFMHGFKHGMIQRPTLLWPNHLKRIARHSNFFEVGRSHRLRSFDHPAARQQFEAFGV